MFVGTDLGPGSMTTSGYPRLMRRWTRGTPVAEAPVVFEAAETDVSAFAGHDHTVGFERDIVGHSPDFHTAEEFVLRPDGSLVLVDVPPDADIEMERAWLLVRTRSRWTVQDAEYPAGALLAFGVEDYLAGGRDAHGAVHPDAEPLALGLGVDAQPPHPHAARRRGDAPRGADPALGSRGRERR